MALANTAGVLIHLNIQTPVQPILNAPMRTGLLRHLCGAAAWQTTDVVVAFPGDFVADLSMTLHADNTLQARL